MHLDEAALVLETSAVDLFSLVSSGKVKAVEIAGEVFVSVNSVFAMKKGGKVQPITMPSGKIEKEALSEYKKYSNLAEEMIWISEAARKYNVLQRTLSVWVSKGFIKTVGKSKNRIVISEQDVAYCVDIYRSAKQKGYRWIFYADGTPYTPKNPK
jgi:hypothetical protein